MTQGGVGWILWNHFLDESLKEGVWGEREELFSRVIDMN